MKKLVFLLAMSLMSSIGAGAQNAKPIVREGVKWVYRLFERNDKKYTGEPDYNVFDFYDEISCTFEFKGDSVLEASKYGELTLKTHKLYRTYSEDCEKNGRTYSTEPQLVALVGGGKSSITGLSSFYVHYEDDYLEEMGDGDVVTSDFDAKGKKRNCLLLYHFPAVNVVYSDARLTKRERTIFEFVQTDSVEVGGEKTACWEAVNLTEPVKHLSCLSTAKPYAKIIEGIGFISNVERVVYSCGSFISPLGEKYYANSRYLVFSHVEENGKIIFKGPDYKEPENMSSVGEITVPANSGDAYYNLQGQRVDNPGAGIYIHGGKKVVVK